MDAESTVDAVDLQSGIEELKRRMEVLVGRQAHAPVDCPTWPRWTRFRRPPRDGWPSDLLGQ